MNPLHKEKYVLSKEAYGNFTIDQNKAKLDKNKLMIKITALVQIIVGIIFIVSVILLKQTSMFVFSVFAVIMIFIGIHGLKKKVPDYDKKIWENIEKSYEGRGYNDSWFELKFFEDKLQYTIGENIDKQHYNDFHAFYETENYFGLHFITGELILFNPDCNREKIKDIITSYRKNIGENAEENVAEVQTEATAE